jgi:hypothetical protein
MELPSVNEQKTTDHLYELVIFELMKRLHTKDAIIDIEPLLGRPGASVNVEEGERGIHVHIEDPDKPSCPSCGVDLPRDWK